MDPQLLFLGNQVLCVIVFLELLINFRKNSLLKLCLLLIITSLFVMNYFAYAGVFSRLHLLVVKAARTVYVCSTILSIIYLVTPRIPRWVKWLIICATITSICFRVINYHKIDIETISQLPNQVFSVGAEFYSPILYVRYTLYALTIVATLIAFYYYRRFLTSFNWESPHYKHLLWWIISLVVPFFMLTIFGLIGNLGLFNQQFSSILFSLFCFIIIFSILFRPRFLNRQSYLEARGYGSWQ
mgnify:CR=1 FL=1|jgi:hypothetical protein